MPRWLVKMDNEPNLKHPGQPILAENQNHFSMINPDDLKSVDEKGNLIDFKKSDEELIISRYWARKSKQIAILVGISSLTLASILIQETDLLNIIFGNLFQVISDLYSTFLGLF